ncbi:MAG: SURF1 family protein [Paracoccaceae bacterium]|nr:SURF1 family protein [Paracoccaceae bacterium]MDG2259919.1 SURF1 family protein [Paracoccaceae bacterium]
MLRRIIFPLLLGVIGTAILLKLGFWQLDRHEWKKGVLTEIGSQITAEPVALPDAPTKSDHQYLSVQASGFIGNEQVHVLASTKQVGAIYRIVSPLRMQDGRKILVDRGYVLDELKNNPRPNGDDTVIGNLLWPDEIDTYTPDPDMNANIWFARDLEKLAAHLNTEPVLLVVRESSQPKNGITPLPVDISGIPNDHFEYVITWFGLALVWVMMSGLLIWRQTRKSEG